VRCGGGVVIGRRWSGRLRLVIDRRRCLSASGSDDGRHRATAPRFRRQTRNSSLPWERLTQRDAGVVGDGAGWRGLFPQIRTPHGHFPPHMPHNPYKPLKIWLSLLETTHLTTVSVTSVPSPRRHSAGRSRSAGWSRPDGSPPADRSTALPAGCRWSIA